MHKFFVANENIRENIAKILGDDVKHIYKVLRLKEGDKVSVNNCLGTEYLGVIQSVDKKEVNIRLVEELPINNESPININLYQGLPKSAKMDLIVQKATELGIGNITPIVTERVVVRSEIGEFNKTERWRRIAVEACKQCKRSLIPSINKPIEFQQFIDEAKEFDLIIVPYENEEGYGVKQLARELNMQIKKVAIIVGPEGGFEEFEINSLRQIGAKIVTLGPRILRTETAGFVCAALLQYELGDLGGELE
jgi:16S rRNA (uracil1498-N3)-methyltransferase